MAIDLMLLTPFYVKTRPFHFRILRNNCPGARLHGMEITIAAKINKRKKAELTIDSLVDPFFMSPAVLRPSRFVFVDT